MSLTRASVSPDLEEAVDRYIHRPVAQILVRQLVATQVTPNQITILSGFVGAGAGILLIAGAHRPALCAWGGLALLISCILDCADGQLARARNQQSPMGMILDGLTDNFVGTAVFVGMTYNLVVYSGTAWMWLLGIAAGLCAAAHVWIFDAKKKQYLECLGLSAPEEPIAALMERARAARARGQRWDSFLLRVYVFFRNAQSVGVAAARVRNPEGFWRANRVRMRAWTFIGSGTHFFLLYVAAMAQPVWPWAMLACALFYVTAMNLLYLALLIAKWRAD